MIAAGAVAKINAEQTSNSPTSDYRPAGSLRRSCSGLGTWRSMDWTTNSGPGPGRKRVGACWDCTGRQTVSKGCIAGNGICAFAGMFTSMLIWLHGRDVMQRTLATWTGKERLV